jgi:hypothetical protein
MLQKELYATFVQLCAFRVISPQTLEISFTQLEYPLTV